MAQKAMIITDPLRTARLYLQLNPNQEKNRALRTLLVALADLETAEPIRDAILFQGELGELTTALLDARMGAHYAAERWRDAATF
jgi:hypothetical protein